MRQIALVTKICLESAVWRFKELVKPAKRTCQGYGQHMENIQIGKFVNLIEARLFKKGVFGTNALNAEVFEYIKTYAMKKGIE